METTVVTESFWMEILKQGGFAFLAGLMFFMYRKDASAWALGQAESAKAYAARQAESAQAFMAFGSATATSLTQVSETMRGMTSVLARIDERLANSHTCPLASAVGESRLDVPHRRRVDKLVQGVVEQARGLGATEDR